jgi:hypothetical protein
MGSAMETSRAGIGTRDRLRDPLPASRDSVTHMARDMARAKVVDNTAASSGKVTARDLRRVSVADALVRAAVMDDPDKAADRNAGDSTRSVPARRRSPI